MLPTTFLQTNFELLEHVREMPDADPIHLLLAERLEQLMLANKELMLTLAGYAGS